MSPVRRDPNRPGASASHAAAPHEEPRPAASPRALLRTVYPLNPGIPHFVDFPRDRR